MKPNESAMGEATKLVVKQGVTSHVTYYDGALDKFPIVTNNVTSHVVPPKRGSFDPSITRLLALLRYQKGREVKTGSAGDS
jgi:hypothetical protein